MTTQQRLNALSDVSAKYNRKKLGYEDVTIKTYDTVDTSTGEITTKARADYDPDKYAVSRKVNKENIKQKALEPFVRIDRTATDGLANNEKLVYYLLTERITWEDNFIRNEDGTFMSISQFSKLTGFSRSHLNPMLSALESKKRIKIVDGGNVKGIYLYAKYVWYGFEKNRNDSKLDSFSRLHLLRASDHRTDDASNTNKKRGDLTDIEYPPLISQSTMTDLSEINAISDNVTDLSEYNDTFSDAENSDKALTDLSEINEISEEMSLDNQVAVIDRITALVSAGDYVEAKSLMSLLPLATQERLSRAYDFDMLIQLSENI